MRRSALCILEAFLFLAATSPASAVHRRAWVTSTTGTGDLSSWPEAGGQSGLAAGDAICRARAAAGGNPNASTYRAWLSDATADAYCHVQGLAGKKANGCSAGTPDPAGPWYRFNGNTPMTAGLARLTGPEREIYRAALYDEFAHSVAGTLSTVVWTGTADDGSAVAGATCAGWTDGSGDAVGGRGIALETAQVWTFGLASVCDSQFRLLCLEPGVSDPPAVRWTSPGSLVFVSRATGSGDLSTWPDAGGANGLAAGDAICRAVAARAHLPAPQSFVAWLSDSATDAADRLISDGPFRRIDGVTIANSKADLLDGSNAASIHQFEDGSYLAGEGGGHAFTGTLADGTVALADHCADWTSDSTSGFGRAGRASATSSNIWTYGGDFHCHVFLHLYCLSNATTLFWDGFDLTGDISRWSTAIP